MGPTFELIYVLGMIPNFALKRSWLASRRAVMRTSFDNRSEQAKQTFAYRAHPTKQNSY